MNPIRQILFATDLSPASETAAHTALEFARRFGATVHLLHVVLPGTATETPPLLGTLADEFKRSVPVTSAVESGSPATQIVRYAEQKHIDLIVIGTHGRTGMTRVLIGSVAERVVRTAPCPVLTVAARQAAGPVAVEGETRALASPRCVVCASPSEDLICEPCRARIRGEVVERKQKEERAGRA
jgi:nucleotide-binding universal stress UspA family protein